MAAIVFALPFPAEALRAGWLRTCARSHSDRLQPSKDQGWRSPRSTPPPAWSSGVCPPDRSVQGVFAGNDGIGERVDRPAKDEHQARHILRRSGGHFTKVHSVHAKSAQHISTKPCFRSEEHTSELKSLMRISYAVF